MNRLSFGFDSDRRAVGALEKTLQDGDELRTSRAELIEVVQGEFAQDLFPVARQLEQHLSLVVARPQTDDQAPLVGAIVQFTGALVARMHSFCERTDRRLSTGRQPFYGEQQLMLLRLDAGGPRRCFAEAEKAADLIAELSHGMQIGLMEYGSHQFIS